MVSKPDKDRTSEPPKGKSSVENELKVDVKMKLSCGTVDRIYSLKKLLNVDSNTKAVSISIKLACRILSLVRDGYKLRLENDEGHKIKVHINIIGD